MTEKRAEKKTFFASPNASNAVSPGPKIPLMKKKTAINFNEKLTA